MLAEDTKYHIHKNIWSHNSTTLIDPHSQKYSSVRMEEGEEDTSVDSRTHLLKHFHVWPITASVWNSPPGHSIQNATTIKSSLSFLV